MVTTNGDSKLLVRRTSQRLARVPRPDYTYDVVEAGYPFDPSNGLCGTLYASPYRAPEAIFRRCAIIIRRLSTEDITNLYCKGYLAIALDTIVDDL